MSQRTDPDPLGDTGAGVKRITTPDGVSRVDTLPEDFALLLGQTKEQIGVTIGGRYKLVERLGSGGMGEVYRAENLAIGLHVAVKVLKPDLLADADFRRRFQREAEAMAAVIHPNVARFLDLVVGDPTFLVMEYLHGQTLSRLLRAETKLPIERALKISLGLCRALKAVHAAHVIHRDLKPSNVIVTSDIDYGETAKLIDFGLAKVACQTQGEALTRTGTIVGTPAYMSPEQISGRPVDPPADIYSLGCLLYHMLAGQPPFVGDDVQVLYKQMHEPAVPVEQLRPDVPPALARLVDRALAKDPLSRHADMETLQRALVAVLQQAEAPPSVDDGATIERRPSDVERSVTIPRGSAARVQAAVASRRRARYRRVAMVLVAAVGVAFSVGFGLAWLQRRAQHTADATLIIISHPQDAHIELDGELLDQRTPAVVTGVHPGLHAVRVLGPAHEPVEQSVTVTSAGRAVVEASLAPVQRKLEVLSSPPGAEVYVDGRLVPGVTPLSVDLAAQDFHRLHIEKTGYEPLDRSIKPEMRDPELAVDLQIESQPYGTLKVDSPLSAEVWIDDVPTGYWTPTLAIRLASGTHKVVLKDPSGRPRSVLTTVAIKQGEITRITPELNGGDAP